MSRALVFILGLFAWWATGIYLWGGRAAVPYVLFFGSFWAVPLSVVALVADLIASALNQRHLTLGFICYAFIGLFGFFELIQLTAIHDRPFDSFASEKQFLMTIGIPTAAMIIVYIFANIQRDLRRSKSIPSS